MNNKQSKDEYRPYTNRIKFEARTASENYSSEFVFRAVFAAILKEGTIDALHRRENDLWLRLNYLDGVQLNGYSGSKMSYYARSV